MKKLADEWFKSWAILYLHYYFISAEQLPKKFTDLYNDLDDVAQTLEDVCDIKFKNLYYDKDNYIRKHKE